MKRLFVYGTLVPGQSNHHVLSDIPGEWERASVTGTLINEGWGSGHGCPGLIPSQDGQEVQGYVFISGDLQKHWDMLDDFEGSDYKRQLISAKLSSGVEVDAYVYSIREGVGP